MLDTVIWGVAYGIGKAQEKPARRRVAAIVASISRYVQDLRPAFSPAPATVAATAVLAAAAAIAGASAVGLGTSPVPVAEPLAAPAPLDDARTAARDAEARSAIRHAALLRQRMQVPAAPTMRGDNRVTTALAEWLAARRRLGASEEASGGIDPASGVSLE